MGCWCWACCLGELGAGLEDASCGQGLPPDGWLPDRWETCVGGHPWCTRHVVSSYYEDEETVNPTDLAQTAGFASCFLPWTVTAFFWPGASRGATFFKSEVLVRSPCAFNPPWASPYSGRSSFRGVENALWDGMGV